MWKWLQLDCPQGEFQLTFLVLSLKSLSGKDGVGGYRPEAQGWKYSPDRVVNRKGRFIEIHCKEEQGWEERFLLHWDKVLRACLHAKQHWLVRVTCLGCVLTHDKKYIMDHCFFGLSAQFPGFQGSPIHSIFHSSLSLACWARRRGLVLNLAIIPGQKFLASEFTTPGLISCSRLDPKD